MFLPISSLRPESQHAFVMPLFPCIVISQSILQSYSNAAEPLHRRLFPSIMKISQETQRGLLTFIGPVHYRHACLLFRKMPGHTLLPGAICLSDCSRLSACRSIPCVNNLSPSDAAEDSERENKQRRVWEAREGLYLCTAMHSITGGLWNAGRNVELEENKARFAV